MEKLTIVLYSVLTVPAIRGGAVETLIEDFIDENEVQKRFAITVIAHEVGNVRRLQKRYRYTRFYYVTWPTILIRANSVLINRTQIDQIPDLWEELLIRAVLKVGNRKVLVEGGSRFVLKIKKRHDNLEVFYHLHADIIPFRSRSELELYDNIYKICVSDHIRDCQIQAGVDQRNVFVALNGINCRRFDLSFILESREEICKRFGLDATKQHILFKGRVIPEKGVLELLQAFRSIKDDKVELVLCGAKNFGEKRIRKSTYERRVERLVRRDPRVIMTGFVNYNQIPLLHKIADIIVVPSIWQEPCALVSIEALVSGVPLICTRTGGSFQICSGTDAVLIDASQELICSLSRELRKLLEHPKRRKQISETEIRKRDYFHVDRYYNDMAKILTYKKNT